MIFISFISRLHPHAGKNLISSSSTALHPSQYLYKKITSIHSQLYVVYIFWYTFFTVGRINTYSLAYDVIVSADNFFPHMRYFFYSAVNLRFNRVMTILGWCCWLCEWDNDQQQQAKLLDLFLWNCFQSHQSYYRHQLSHEMNLLDDFNLRNFQLCNPSNLITIFIFLSCYCQVCCCSYQKHIFSLR